MKSLSFLLCACALLAGCSPREQSAADASARLAPGKPLVLLTHPTEPPCSYTNAQGVCLGTDVELARAIAAKLGRPLEIRASAFEDIIPQLKKGQADLGIATITITEARRRDVDFSEPYNESGNCFLYRAGGKHPHMSQIHSLRIGAEADTTADLYLCRHGCDPIRFAHMEEAVGALLRDEVDAIFFDAIPLQNWAKKSGGKLVAMPLETREEYGVAVDKRRPDVLAAANAVIAARKGGAK